MDAGRWERLKELLDLALQKEPNQRSAFLNQACSGDESLLQEVESLLVAYQEAGPTVSGAKRIPLAFQSAAEQESVPHRRIGPYQILHRVGSGGMATVYLATRADDEYRKSVAIKVIRPGIANQELLRRFRNERQTLAALDHPNIVRLLDGGTTDDGMPYLVMDYVEGTSIDSYCDCHKLATVERLRLFLAVCSAVSYAHQRLVIHRDLKPGNIMVASDGTPKLLDFGIAKLLNPEALATLVLTQTGFRPMTLAYASPEQIRGEPLTNATDVYSLGVVLYELLTGQLPHQMRGSALLTIERAICEEEPAKPSTAATRVEEEPAANGMPASHTPEAASRTWGGDPKKLRDRLRGDLDAIVMTALRKEPQRRYASVYDFSEDIRRHLEHLPVKARSSALGYRGAKFVRRHREMAATTLMFVLLLGMALGWYATTRGRSGSYRLAPVQGRRSIAVLGFKNLSGKTDDAWLSTALSEMLTTELTAGEKLRTIPEENVARMKLDLSLPDSDSLAQDTLKKVYRNLGSDLVVLGSYLNVGDTLRVDLELQDAGRGETIAALSETGAESHLLDLVNRAGEQLREKCGVSEVAKSEVAAATNSIIAAPNTSRLYSEALSKMRVFDFIGAKELLEQAETADAKQPLIHQALGEAWSKLGYEAKAAAEAKQAFELSGSLSRDARKLIEGQYSEAARRWSKAVEIYRDLLQSFPDNVDYGLSLARAQTASGAGKDALLTVEKLHDLRAPMGQDPRIDLAEAHAASAISDYNKAEAAAEVASSKAQSLGARFLVAEAKMQQGGAFAVLGAYDKAIPVLRDAAGIYQETGDEAGQASVLIELGTVSYNQGNLAEAHDLLAQALAIARRIGNRKIIATALIDLANSWSEQAQYERAAVAYQQALAIEREIGDKRGIAVALANLGGLLGDRGDFAKAMPAFEEQVSIARDIGDKRSLAYGLLNSGMLIVLKGRLADGRDRFNEALTLAQQSDDRRQAASVTSEVGGVLLAQGDLAGAGKMEEGALAISTELGEKHLIATFEVALARVMMAENRFAEAEAQLRQAASAAQKEESAELEVEANAALTTALLAQNKVADAGETVRRTRQIAVQTPVIRIQAAIADAELTAAQGKTVTAGKSLRALVSQAAKLSCVPCQFEARLALGQMEMKSGQTSAGRAHLHALELDAQAQDFVLIARQAAEAENVPQAK